VDPRFGRTVSLLDQILLILLVIELLYTEIRKARGVTDAAASEFRITDAKLPSQSLVGQPAKSPGYVKSLESCLPQFIANAASLPSRFVSETGKPRSAAANNSVRLPFSLIPCELICIAQTSFAPRSILGPITEKSGLCVDEL
jgi:hypothetical protein